MKEKSWLIIGIAVAIALAAMLVCVSPADAGKLEDAISQTPTGTGPGMVDPNAAKGFMNIPGGPKPFWLYGILWGIWVGWIFSSVGAFGGIMAGVGHITVFGLGDYASTFKKTNPVLNKLLTDSIRTSNQYLVGLSAFISSLTYYRMGRLVLPLGVCLAAGGILGAYLIPVLTAGKINLSQYVGYFGITVLVIGGFLFYETTPAGQKGKKAAKAAAEAFEREHMGKGGGAKANPATQVVAVSRGGAATAAITEANTNHAAEGVRVVSWGMTKITFTFYGVEFSFKPIIPIVGGFVIAAISAFIGVGGGFLYVPFLTSIAGLPMYIVAGTSALAVLISMITSIFTYMFVKGTPVDLLFIGVELVGIIIGSILGPITSKKIPDIWLKRIFVVLALYVGIGYATKGFLGHSIFPGM